MKLLINTTECWKCSKPMKVALLFDGGGFDDPSVFTDKLLVMAREKGVKLEDKHSNMMEETYTANICPHCGSMYGRMFLCDFYSDEAEEEIDLSEYKLEELINIAP